MDTTEIWIQVNTAGFPSRKIWVLDGAARHRLLTGRSGIAVAAKPERNASALKTAGYANRKAQPVSAVLR